MNKNLSSAWHERRILLYFVEHPDALMLAWTGRSAGRPGALKSSGEVRSIFVSLVDGEDRRLLGKKERRELLGYSTKMYKRYLVCWLCCFERKSLFFEKGICTDESHKWFQACSASHDLELPNGMVLRPRHLWFTNARLDQTHSERFTRRSWTDLYKCAAWARMLEQCAVTWKMRSKRSWNIMTHAADPKKKKNIQVYPECAI